MPDAAAEPAAVTAAAGGAQAAPPSRPANELLWHVGAYTATTFGLRGMNFLLLALYSRFLLPADYGTVALSDTMALIAMTVAGGGTDGAFRRLYFQYEADSEARRDYVATVFRLVLLASALLALLAAGLWYSGASLLGVAFYPFLMLSLAASACTMLAELRLGLWQIQKQPRRYAGFAFFAFLATTAGVVGLVVGQRQGATGLLAGKALGAGLAAIAALVASRAWLAGHWRWQFARETLRLGWPLVPHQLLALGLVAADRFILERYRDLSEVGLYSMAYTLGMVMFLVTTALSLAWSPTFYDLARNDENRTRLGRMTSGIMLAQLAVASFGILIAQDFTRLFLGSHYASAARLVPWVIAGYLFHGIFSLMQPAVLHAKRPHWFMVASALALALNVALNLWWVPRWGMYDSAWATTAAYAAEAALMFLVAQRVFRLRFDGATIVGGGVLFAASFAVAQLTPTGYRAAAVLVTLSVVGALYLALSRPYWTSFSAPVARARRPRLTVFGTLERNYSIDRYCDEFAAAFPADHVERVTMDRRAGWRRFLDIYWNYPRHAARAAGDLNVVVSETYAFLLAVLPPASTVIICHDVHALIEQRAVGFWRSLRPSQWRRLAYVLRYRLNLRFLARARYVVAVSHNTRSELLAYCPYLRPEQIVAIPNGLGMQWRPLSDRSALQPLANSLGVRGKRVLLHVGNDNWYKNFAAVLRAFAQLQREDVVLVKVGEIGNANRALMDSLGISGRVIHVPAASGEELFHFYNLADALIFPSLHEGFGWPPLEAMACACPVLASTGGSLPEVCGDAALLVDPNDVPAIAAGIERLLDEAPLRVTLRERGLRRAQQFSWQRTAARIMELVAKRGGN